MYAIDQNCLCLKTHLPDNQSKKWNPDHLPCDKNQGYQIATRSY